VWNIDPKNTPKKNDKSVKSGDCLGVGTSSKEQGKRKVRREWVWLKYFTNMYENTTMKHVKIV
jgi:hypothetical protein